MKTNRLYIIIAVLLLSVAAYGAKSTFTGKVVSIKDGDTIEVMRKGKAVRVRLAGIDCPEKNQAFGSRARQFTSDMVFGREVTVTSSGKDRYGRYVGVVVDDKGRNLNQELLKAGMAWWYKQYSKDKTLKALEDQARAAKIGLWSDPNPVSPWEFRKMRREQGSKKEKQNEKTR